MSEETKQDDKQNHGRAVYGIIPLKWSNIYKDKCQIWGSNAKSLCMYNKLITLMCLYMQIISNIFFT